MIVRSILVSGLFVLSQTSMASENNKTISVSQDVVKLSMADFRPITKNYASRKAVVGYEALIDVADAKPSMFFELTGEMTAKWFSSNFATKTTVSCSGIPVGVSYDYGKIVKGKKRPAQPAISELRHNMEDCTQLKIEITKRGSLSRQFYTQIQNISFEVSMQEIDAQREESN